MPTFHLGRPVARRRADLQGSRIEVDFQRTLAKDKDKLAEIIGNYDGLAIPLGHQVSPNPRKGERLKVIGRAGIGVDTSTFRRRPPAAMS